MIPESHAITALLISHWDITDSGRDPLETRANQAKNLCQILVNLEGYI